jgi:hypothetical protein
MKTVFCAMVLCLLMMPSVRAQQRPTLGPAEPSLNGPSSSTTNDRIRLLHMRKIYIERIDNQLSDKLMDDLVRSGLVKVVDKRQNADAVLGGTCFNSRRLKEVHSEVFISDQADGASIWQDIVRIPYNPPPLSKAVDTTAAEIVAHLAQSIRAATH